MPVTINGSTGLTTNDGSVFTNGSGNVGIGTSSPGAKLDVAGTNAGSTLSSRILNTSTAAGSDAQQFIYVNGAAAGDPYTTWTVGGVTSWSAGIRNSASDNWYLSPGSSLGTSPVLVATTDGNLGLGVTPTTTSRATLQIGSLLTIDNQANISNNAAFNSGWKYMTTAAAAQYYVGAGAHYWYTAPSGTAGNAISFTQAMTLDASGNLGIGTSDPATWGKLTVSGAGTTTPTNFENLRASSVVINDTNGGAAGSTSGFFVARGTASGSVGLAGGYGVLRENSSNWGTALTFYTHPADTADIKQLVERARIDSSGKVLINETSRWRGNGILSITTGADDGIAIKTDSAGLIVRKLSYSNSYLCLWENNSGGAVGSITTNGTNTTYATSSDYRLKEDVQPMTGALAKVSALKPCTYKWKVDGTDGQGFIAHELQEVVPDAVVGEKDAVDAEGKPVYQGIDTSFLVATLTAAIQEQQALIAQLQADVAALKGAQA